MKYYIDQSAGLGDILFCQKIAYNIKSVTSGEIIWPITTQYSYLSEYIGNEYNFINRETLHSTVNQLFSRNTSTIQNFINENNDECKYIPLTNSHVYRGNISVMEYKYSFMNMDYNNWGEYFKIKRNYDKESTLLKYLGIKSGDKFNLVNLTFGTYPGCARFDGKLDIQNEYKNIEMSFLGFDRIFDWIGVLELAQEIHTVNTSLVYIIETLPLSAKLCMYSRNGNNMDMWYSPKMYKREWNYIPYD